MMTYFDTYECFGQKENGALFHIEMCSEINISAFTLPSDRLKPQIGGLPIALSGPANVSITKIEPLHVYEKKLLHEKSVLLQAKRLREERSAQIEVVETIIDAVGLILIVVPGAQLALPEYVALRVSLGLAEGFILLAKYMNGDEKGKFIMSFASKKLWGKLVAQGFKKIQLKLPAGANARSQRIIFRAKEISKNVKMKTGEIVADGTFEYVEKKLNAPGLNNLDAIEFEFLQLHAFKYDFDPSYKQMVDNMEASYKSFALKLATGQSDSSVWKSNPTK